MTQARILDILATDLELLKQLKQLFQHQQICIAGRNAQSLQESSRLMESIADATQQNNRAKIRHLEQNGIVLSELMPWEKAAEQLINSLPTPAATQATKLLNAVKTLAEECRLICQNNQKTMVMQQALTGKMLNRLRGPATDNGSAYGADGSTRLTSDSLSLAMA